MGGINFWVLISSFFKISDGQQFYVAAGGPEWDDNIPSIDDLEYFLDGTASNVENGLGYVVGIDLKWVPYDTCVTADSSNVIPCEPEEPYWYDD